MTGNTPKKRFPFLWLLLIPGQLLVCILALVIAAELDTRIVENAAESMGHPAPAFTLIAILFTVVTMVIALILGIVLMAGGYRKKKQEKKSAEL